MPKRDLQNQRIQQDNMAPTQQWARSCCAVLALITALYSLPARAETPGVVIGLQLPAWVVRDGTRISAMLGMELRERDRLETGAGARVLIRMQDGSQIKVGENARLELTLTTPARGRLLRAVIDVLQGAFRLTTAITSRVQSRELTIRVSTLALGVRGTDVWGKAAEDRNIVCLIDGHVDVEDRANNKSFTMTQPLTFYIAPHGRTPLPVQPVPRRRLKGWAKETELLSGRGVLRTDGVWAVRLVSRHSVQEATAARQELREAGYPADVVPAVDDGSIRFDVSMLGFVSKKDARTFKKKITDRHGVSQPTLFRTDRLP